MNDDKASDVPSVGETDTTPPNPSEPPQNSGGWKMPEPKFQKTSGYLPQGYLDQVAPQTAAAAAAPAAVSSENVVEQPDVGEQIDDSPSAPPVSLPPAKQRSRAMRVTMIVFGLLAMIAFIAVFLAVIYFLFIAPRVESGQF